MKNMLFSFLFLATYAPLNAMETQAVSSEEIIQTTKESWVQALENNIHSGKSIKESIEQAFEEFKQSSPLKNNPEAMKKMKMLFQLNALVMQSIKLSAQK